jgi:hypothetical protein
MSAPALALGFRCKWLISRIWGGKKEKRINHQGTKTPRRNAEIDREMREIRETRKKGKTSAVADRRYSGVCRLMPLLKLRWPIRLCPATADGGGKNC